MGFVILTLRIMNFWQNIDKPIIGLSPMDGVSDASFRFITAKHGGPDVTISEFVNIETLIYAPHNLVKDLTYSEMERPVVAQIYGHTPELFYQVAHVVCELGFDGLDINMGCPAKKVVSKGSGAGLILNPPQARSIIQSARLGIQHWFEGQTLGDLKASQELIQGVERSNRLRNGTGNPPLRRLIPVSVKTRLGYDQIVVEDWIQTLLQEKLAAISLHGRTLKQKYRGSADWESIARAVELAENSETLILGNGDLQSMEDVYRRVRETRVDGVLLGRSTQGNPWIFRTKDQVKQALRHDGALEFRPSPVSLEERIRVILEHSDYFQNHCGSPTFVGMRKHLAWYCRGIHGASELRAQMVRVSSVSEVMECLKNYVSRLPSRIEPPNHMWLS